MCTQICEEALLKVAGGDNSALEAIYNELGRCIFATAIVILHDYQSAQDVMHDTFMTIAAKADTYKVGSDAKAWITAIARNHAIDKLRQGRFTVSVAEPAASEIFAENAAEESAEIYRALGMLSDEERQIVALKAISGYSHGEIAEQLNISLASCQKKYQRALQKLREILTNE